MRPLLFESCVLLPSSNPWHVVGSKHSVAREFVKQALLNHELRAAGVFFGGFARNKRGSTDPNDNRAMQSRTSLFKQRPRLMDVSLRIRDFRKPFWGPRQPDVIYCDPPYAGTSAVGTDRKTKTDFPSDAFYEWCKIQASKGSVVLISEYTCPIKEAEVIWTKTYFKSLRSADGVRHKVERLYCLYPPNRTASKIGFGF